MLNEQFGSDTLSRFQVCNGTGCLKMDIKKVKQGDPG